MSNLDYLKKEVNLDDPYSLFSLMLRTISSYEETGGLPPCLAYVPNKVIGILDLFKEGKKAHEARKLTQKNRYAVLLYERSEQVKNDIEVQAEDLRKGYDYFNEIQDNFPWTRSVMERMMRPGSTISDEDFFFVKKIAVMFASNFLNRVPL